MINPIIAEIFLEELSKIAAAPLGALIRHPTVRNAAASQRLLPKSNWLKGMARKALLPTGIFLGGVGVGRMTKKDKLEQG